jgi:hypothetical protein
MAALAQGDDFRMSRWIIQPDRAVMTSADNLLIHQKHGAHWNFSLDFGIARL